MGILRLPTRPGSTRMDEALLTDDSLEVSAPTNTTTATTAAGGSPSSGTTLLSPDTLLHFGVVPTFTVMTRRRLRRRLSGIRQPQLPTLERICWIALYLGIAIAFVLVDSQGLDNIDVRLQVLEKPTTLLFFGLILTFMWIAMGKTSVVRWCLCWLLVGTGLLIVVGGEPHKNPTNQSNLVNLPSPAVLSTSLWPFSLFQGSQPTLIWVGMLVLIAITVIIWACIFYIYPALVLCLGTTCTVGRLWSIRRLHRSPNSTPSPRRVPSSGPNGARLPRSGARSGGPLAPSGLIEYTYSPLHFFSRIPLPATCQKRRHCSYEGEIGESDDGACIPRDWGTWAHPHPHPHPHAHPSPSPSPTHPHPHSLSS